MDGCKVSFRRTIRRLEEASGSGTTLVSVYVPARTSQFGRMTKKIADELSVASNIKSRETRSRVTSALRSILVKLKSIRKVPPRGLAIFCGVDTEAVAHSERSKQNLTVVIPPIGTIPHALYSCGSTFELSPLHKIAQQAESGASVGFVVVSGTGTVFARLAGDSGTEIVQNTSVRLPKKHGRGGQSAPRFQRQRI